jgi:hypothetical protein
MKILVTPNVHVREGPGEGPGQAQGEGGGLGAYAANLLHGYWERAPQQRWLLHRLR